MIRYLLLAVCSFAFALDTLAVTKTWTGAVDNRWSVGGNWSDGTPPADGDSLIFPGNGVNQHTVNDLVGLDLVSVTYKPTSFVSSATGNAVTLSSGLVKEDVCCAPITWALPTTLTASQTFSGGQVEFASTINLNGFTLTFASHVHTVSGSITGSGAVVHSSGELRIAGTSNFTGTFTVGSGAHLKTSGSIAQSPLILNANAFLSGSGTLPATTSTSATIQPGQHSPGACCADPHTTGMFATGSLALNGGTLQIDIEGTTPGSEFDQLAVTGSVTLNNPALQVSMTAAPPVQGQSFTIITNDATDGVSGTFAGLPEGAIFTVAGLNVQITYAGGDGNDVVLTVLSQAPKSWTGAVNNLWSVGGNWSGGVPPSDGDALVFPQVASNQHTVNDIAGLDLTSILYRQTAFVSSASGNAITLSSGLTMECCGTQVTWSIPITLTASQTFGGGALDFAGPIALNSHTLTIAAHANRFSGSLTGTGAVVVSSGHLTFSGSTSYTGPLTFAGGVHVHLTGSSINNSSVTVSSGATVTGSGALSATTSSGTLRPSNASDSPGSTGNIATGNLAMNGGRLEIDAHGTAPGAQYDRVTVTGTVALNNPELQFTPTFTATPGDVLIIILNDGSDPVTGTFLGLPQGAVFTRGPNLYRISYTGGDGNDVILQAVAATSTTLASSKNPTVAGEPFTLTATVTSGSGTPTGTVRFRSGATTLAIATLGPAGTATATVQLPAGTHSIVAEYEGGGIFAPSTSATLNQVVERGATSTMVTPTNATITHGAPLTLTIDVAAAAPATGTPTGTVTVTVAGITRQATLDNAGRTVVNVASLPPGLHNGSVSYGGDTNFAPGNAAFTVQVLPVITIADAAAQSGGTSTTVAVPVTLSGPSNQTVRVDYNTANGTATAGSDYVAATGTLEFTPGQTTQTIVITILGDPEPDRPETFRVVLSNPQNAAIGDAEAVVTITNITAIPTLGELALLLTAMALALAGALALKR